MEQNRTEEYINRKLLEVWKEVDPTGWVDIVKDILNVYLDSVPQDFQKFILAREEKNFQEMQRIAHSLKSSSGNVGAQRLQFLFQNVEDACHHGQVDVAIHHCRHIELQFRSTIQEINKYLSEIKQ